MVVWSVKFQQREIKMNRNEVVREIDEFRESYARTHLKSSDWKSPFFNNFWMNLPGPMSRMVLYSEAGVLDKRASHDNLQGMSMLLRGQTWREFFETVRETAVARGFDEKVFAHLESLSRAGHSEKREEVYHIIEPIYLDLRERGYNHYPDLTV